MGSRASSREVRVSPGEGEADEKGSVLAKQSQYDGHGLFAACDSGGGEWAARWWWNLTLGVEVAGRRHNRGRGRVKVGRSDQLFGLENPNRKIVEE